MAEVCSLYKRGFLECGPSRGRTETVFVYACRDNISAHLKICSLSRSNLREFEVILERAGLDRMPLDEVKKNYVFVLAIVLVEGGTGGLQSCASIQGTKGSPTRVKGREKINIATAQEVYVI